MDLIHHALPHAPAGLPRVALTVDRHTAAKTRWRGTAADGREFGFDLHHPLAPGDVFFASDTAAYVLAQQPEPVLELDLSADPAEAARLGWSIGNLHLPAQVDGAVLRLADDPGVRRALERLHLAPRVAVAVFTPPRVAGHAHGHAHAH